MDKTDFAGLTRLAPGEPLSEDGYSFQAVNPRITDQLLKVGALLHRHNAAPALADPTLEPAVVLTAGGIPADTTISVVYTLVDTLGGETLPSPIETVVTAPPLDNPSTIPDIEIQYDAGGTLPIGSYAYAIAVTDGAGGITLVGPAVTINRDPGFASAKVSLSGLADVVASVPGATGWRAYKSTNQGLFHYIADGVADVLVDDGTLCANCSERAPVQNTTGSTSGITVTVPTSAQLVASTGVRIYIGEDGNLTNPSFVEQVTTAEALAGRTYPTILVEDGAPPDASTCVPGANKIDPDTELLDWTWKRPVADEAALPADADPGETRITLDTGLPFTYFAGAWTPWADLAVGGGGGHEVYQRDGDTGIDTLLPQRSKLVLETYDPNNIQIYDDAANDATVLSVMTGNSAGAQFLDYDDPNVGPAYGYIGLNTGWRSAQAINGSIWVVARIIGNTGLKTLEGMVTKTSAPAAGDIMFTLPVGFRPSNTILRLAVIAGDNATPYAQGAISIGSDGTVRWQGGQIGTGRFVALDGITFR